MSLFGSNEVSWPGMMCFFVALSQKDPMVVEMVPLKGGLGSIVHPPIGSIYHLYIAF